MGPSGKLKYDFGQNPIPYILGMFAVTLFLALWCSVACTAIYRGVKLRGIDMGVNDHQLGSIVVTTAPQPQM